MNLSKKQEYLIIAGLLVLIFPFFALLLYVHPQGDDFFFAFKMQSQSLFNFVKEMYLTWSGRYFSMLLGAMDPYTTGSISGLRLSLIVFQVFFITSIFLLLKSILPHKFPFKKTVIISLSFYLLYINSIISPFELLFWYPAASAYQLGLSVITTLISLILFNKKRSLNNYLLIVFGSILIFIGIGLVELTIIPILIITFLNMLFDSYYKKKIRISFYLFVLAISFSLVMILAPGNYMRHDVIGSNIDIGMSLWLALKITFFTLIYSIKNPITIVASILVLPILESIIKNNPFFFNPKIKPYHIVVASLSIIVLLYFPTTIILKHLPPSRVINFVSYFLLGLWFFTIVFTINYYKNKLSFSISKSVRILLVITLIIFTFSGVFAPNKKEIANNNYKSVFFSGNILKAYYFLVFEAGSFDTQMTNRKTILVKTASKGEKSVEIEPIYYKTSLINFLSINETDYQFNWEAKSYNIDSIYIKAKTK